MADNYLEKKMEEHRAGGGCSSSYRRPRLTPRGNRPGEMTVDFTPCEILIDDIDMPGMTQVARELVAVGFKVCFSVEDIHRGAKLASTLGCRFLPPSFPLPSDAIKLRAGEGWFELCRWRDALRMTLTATGDPVAVMPPECIKTIVWMASMLANLNEFQENVLKNIKIEGHSL